MKTVVIEFEKNGILKQYDLLIGETQADNDKILKQSHQNDTWFHLENLSSPHFVLSNNGDLIPKKQLNLIASMFKDFKTGLGTRYSVIYTEVKNVKLTEIPGKVTTSRLKILKV
jgi:predicted ribosome quality control (RQC) complex YloA/Tae2 family protein